ncbi:MAG TPA: HAD family phosphatase [Terriglobales bacterium]|jgi:beta-phosphoglucomutase|nr:HAD family phosphatase [Terriglobales bacterium]
MKSSKQYSKNTGIIVQTAALDDVRAVVFDWDGVLVDSAQSYYLAYEWVLKQVGIDTTPREIYLREGQPTPDLIATLCSERGISITVEKIAELVQLRRDYDMSLGTRKLFPGIWDLLTDLCNAGYKLGMVTGSSRKSVNLLLPSNRQSIFNAVVTADDVTKPKPDPQPFLMAAERMKLDPKGCIVVENAPYGVRSAKAAGCRVIAICTTLDAGDLNSADWIVRDHNALKLLLSTELRLHQLETANPNHDHHT